MHESSIQVLFASDQHDSRPRLTERGGEIRAMTAASDRMLHQFLAIEDDIRHVFRCAQNLRDRMCRINIHGLLLRQPVAIAPGMEYFPDDHPYWNDHTQVWRTTAGIVTRCNPAEDEMPGTVGDIDACVVTDLHVDCRYNRIESIMRLLRLIRACRHQTNEALRWDVLMLRVCSTAERLRERLEHDGFAYVGFGSDDYTMAWFAGPSEERMPDFTNDREEDA